MAQDDPQSSEKSADQNVSSEVAKLVEQKGYYRIQRTVGTKVINRPNDKDIFFHLEVKDLCGFAKGLAMNCYTEEGDKVSHLTSYIIKRHPSLAAFYVNIRNAPVKCGQSMVTCALELFDRYGRLQEDLYNHPANCGSGNWAKELDEGDFFYISAIYVDERWRRLGLGRKSVEKILDTAQRQFGIHFAYARPGSYNPYSNNDGHKNVYLGNPPEIACDFQYRLERERRIVQNTATAVRFWRARGFRRIGSTKYFCFAMDPAHKSRITCTWTDFDPTPKRLIKPDNCDVGGQHTKISCDERRVRKMVALWPIHKAILNSKIMDTNGSDGETDCLEFLEIRFRSYPIKQNDSSWRACDEYGNTLAHLAAGLGLPKTLKWILDHLGLEVAKVRNSSGETAEEVITGRTELARRTFAMTGTSKHCAIITPGMTKCLFLLQESKANFDDIPVVELARKRMGCTCGECIDGFLSPSMRICLLRYAQIAHGTFSSACEFGVDEILGTFGYSAEQSRHEKAAFKKTLHTIIECLEMGAAPSILNVRESIHGECEGLFVKEVGSKNELDLKTIVTNALMKVCQLAAEGDEMTGTGFSKVFFTQVKYRPCRNDVEYDFVQHMLLQGKI